ncbi:hypothetical protein GCM10027572_26350 [Flexivirga lutea]
MRRPREAVVTACTSGPTAKMAVNRCRKSINFSMRVTLLAGHPAARGCQVSIWQNFGVPLDLSGLFGTSVLTLSECVTVHRLWCSAEHDMKIAPCMATERDDAQL